MNGFMQKNLFNNPVYERRGDIDPYAHFKKLPKWIKDEFSIEPTQKLKHQDEDYICRVLVEVLKYPDKKQAQLHRMANIMGRGDLKSEKKGSNQPNGNKDINESKQNIFTQDSINDDIPLQSESQSGNEFCKCCGFMKQRSQISICQAFEDFPTIGLSTFLYFRTIINCIYMLLVLLIVYCLFGMFINYYVFVESQGLSLLTGLDNIALSYDTIFSYRSVQLNYIQYEERIIVYGRVSAILIMIVVIVWSFLVYLFKHFQVEYEEMIDDESITASDFSIVIEDAPIDLFKDISTVTLQFGAYFRNIRPIIEKQYFDIYLNKKDSPVINVPDELSKLRVTKINIGIPFYLNENNLDTDQQYKQLQEALEDHKDKLTEWVEEFFDNKQLTVKEELRQKRLQDFKETQTKIQKKKVTFLKALEKQYKEANPTDEMTTTVFVTFETALAAKIVYELNPNGLLSTIKYYLTCCNSDRILKIKGKNGKFLDLKIQRAPQPQDIIWQNIGFSFGKILLRRVFTYFITAIILTGSYFLITFLSTIQLQSDSFLVGIAISFSLTALNIAIGLVIYTLTVFEKDFTHTNYQASLSLKSVFAQLINCIVIPVMIKKENIYGRAGLVEDVFWLVISCAFVDPILKMLDVYYLYTRINYWLKCRPYSRIGLDQSQLNSYAQKMQFQAGFQYIYVANLFLISCFFTPIQPITPVISIIGLLLMYWSQKYSLLSRMKRPVPGSDMVNVAMGSVITLGPIMLAGGNMVFSDYLSAHGEGNLKFLLHIISIGIGVFFYLLPFKLIYRCIFSEDEVFDNITYFQNRILLPSEYDRINPATSQQGMEDLMKYLGQINSILANQSNNYQNQTAGNNRLVNNLAKFVQKSQKNPHSKQAKNLKNAAAGMNQGNMLGSLLGPKQQQKAGVHGLNEKGQNKLTQQLQKKLNKPSNQPPNSKPQPEVKQPVKKRQLFDPPPQPQPPQQKKQPQTKPKQEIKQSQFLRDQYKKKSEDKKVEEEKKKQQLKKISKPVKSNEPFVNQVDENDFSIFDKKPPISNNSSNPLQFIQKPRVPEKKPEAILGMEFKPIEKPMQAYNKNFNTPQNAPKYDPRKIKTQVYEPLEEDSPYKQKSPQRRSQKSNFLKIKNTKAPKMKTDQNQINLTREDLNPSYRQNQFPQERLMQLNHDKSLSPERRQNEYSSPQKVFTSPVKIRPADKSYDRQERSIPYQSNNDVQYRKQKQQNPYRQRRNSVPYNEVSNDPRNYQSNQKINQIEQEDLIDYQNDERGMEFNGYSIDYQKERRKNSRNNPYASMQSNRKDNERSYESYQRSREY